MSGKVNVVYKKSLAKLIALPIVAVVCVLVLILANYYLNYYKAILHRVFAGDGISLAGSSQVLSDADKVVRTTAEESMVLLYNDDGNGDDFLPLKTLRRVNLFGWGATDGGFLLTGGGSGGATILDVDRNGNKRTKIDLTEAFTEAGIEYNKTLTDAYVNFSDFDADYRRGGTTGADVTESLKNPDASFYTEARMNQAKTYSTTAVAVISRWGAENASQSELKELSGYSGGSYLELTSQEIAMFDALEQYGFDVIVVLNVCNNIELGFLEEYSSIKACIFAGIPGQSGAIAIPEIINGTVNPSGRTSDTLPYDHQTYDPTYINAVKYNGIVYQEGIYFGYKWYETADAVGFFEDKGTSYDEVVQFPFGYGLSYSTFTWEADFSAVPAILTKDGEYTVTVTVTNNGPYAGKDVVQLYGHSPYFDGVEKAERVLLDFAKTPLIEPNESEKVTLTFTAYDLASYDAYDDNNNNHTGYELDAGNYEIQVMRNSHEFNKTENPTEGVENVDYRVMQLPKPTITFDNDPVTGNKVDNLFTGSNAYANCPIDGSATNFTYLSRKDKFANYPTELANRSGSTPTLDAVKTANKQFLNEEEVKKGVQYGIDASMYLVGSVDENGTIQRVSLDALSGNDASVKLAYNTVILEFLLDEGFENLWDSLLNQVTQAETLALIGQGGFQTTAMYSVGKPRCVDKDGPAGFNNSVDDAVEAKSDQYTLFCSESLTGCSFNKEVAYAIGEAQAKIGREVGFQGWYGPGVNLHRTVFNSRNYEYYSEDAVLSGKLAAETINAAYENNMYCYLKHFAVSEAGYNPKMLNTWLTEQTLRETYLRPFEIAVKYGNANAIMSAFNNIGGVLAGYNGALLNGVLRNEWGFKGSVITDWFMKDGYMNDYEAGVLAGNDLWLAGTSQTSADLNLNDEYVAYAARQSVKNILYTYIDTNATATEIIVNAAPKSGLVIFLWVLLNVLFGLGFIACVVFLVLPYGSVIFSFTKPKSKGGNTLAFAASGGDSAASGDANSDNAGGETSDNAGGENSDDAQPKAAEDSESENKE